VGTGPPKSSTSRRYGWVAPRRPCNDRPSASVRSSRRHARHASTRTGTERTAAPLGVTPIQVVLHQHPTNTQWAGRIRRLRSAVAGVFRDVDG
jgi:hypothetical protein